MQKKIDFKITLVLSIINLLVCKTKSNLAHVFVIKIFHQYTSVKFR